MLDLWGWLRKRLWSVEDCMPRDGDAAATKKAPRAAPLASAAGFPPSPRHRARCAAFIIFSLAACLPGSPAHSDKGTDAAKLGIDLAIEAVDKAGILPLSPDEKTFGKVFLKCMVDGDNVTDCAARSIEQFLPKKAADFSRCMREEEKNAVACGKKLALDAVQQKAAETTEKLKSHGRIGRVIEIIEAVRNEDWEKVAALAGLEAYKAAVCTVVVGLLQAGPHTREICNALHRILESGVDAVKNVVKAAKAKDWLELAKTLFKFMAIDIPCSYLDEGAVKQFICGGLATILNGIKEGYGVVLGPVLDLITGLVEKALGVIGGVIKDVGCAVGIGDCGTCLTPAQYYANHFITCFHRSAYLGLEGKAAERKREGDTLHHHCYKHFDECMSGKDARGVCDGLYKLFNDQAATLINAMHESSQSFTKTQQSSMEAQRAKICAPGEFDGYANLFQQNCENKMRERFPLAGGNTPDCKPANCAGLFTCGGATAHGLACGKVKDGSYKRVYSEVCAGAGVCFKTEEPEPFRAPK